MNRQNSCSKLLKKIKISSDLTFHSINLLKNLKNQPLNLTHFQPVTLILILKQLKNNSVNINIYHHQKRTVLLSFVINKLLIIWKSRQVKLVCHIWFISMTNNLMGSNLSQIVRLMASFIIWWEIWTRSLKSKGLIQLKKLHKRLTS